MDNAILIVSHVNKIALGLKELLNEMAPNTKIYAFGGLEGNRLGSNYENIKKELEQFNDINLISFYDLGSSKLCLKVLKKELINLGINIEIMDVALVEGAFYAATLIESFTPLEELKSKIGIFNLEK